MNRPKLQAVPCRRCGREILSLTGPLYGAREAYEKYAGICDRCTTPEERADCNRRLLEAAVLNAAGVRIVL